MNGSRSFHSSRRLRIALALALSLALLLPAASFSPEPAAANTASGCVPYGPWPGAHTTPND